MIEIMDSQKEKKSLIISGKKTQKTEKILKLLSKTHSFRGSFIQILVHSYKKI